MDKLNRLLDTWEKLGERERLCLLVLAMRIKRGQTAYGPMTVDKKDWTYEALEEVMDGLVYMAIALQDKSDKALASIVTRAEDEVMANPENFKRVEPEQPAAPAFTYGADGFHGLPASDR